jgi:two-component system, LytTR family, response regulator
MEDKIKVIIVEDESPARALLRNYLEAYTRIEVIYECTDGFEGAKKINEFKPDLIFLDIQMPRINGFEMLELLDRDHLPVIIFTTAYDEFAIKAFEYSACDYLLKPLGLQRFEQAMIKALEQIDKKTVNLNLDKIIDRPVENNHYLDRVVIRSGSHIQVVHCDDLLCLQANDDYVVMHTEKEQFIKKQTLTFYETRLNPKDFLRVHRSCIINLATINRIEPYSKDAFIAILHNGLKLPVSKAGYSKLKETLHF